MGVVIWSGAVWAKAASMSDASNIVRVASIINRLFEALPGNIKSPEPIDIEITALCQQIGYAQIVSTRFGFAIDQPNADHNNDGACDKRQCDVFAKYQPCLNANNRWNEIDE